MKRKYTGLLTGLILSFVMLTGCGVRTGAPQDAGGQSGGSEREAELEAQIDALQQEIDALKECQGNTGTDDSAAVQSGNDAQSQEDAASRPEEQGGTAQSGTTQNEAGNSGRGGAANVAVSFEEAQAIALERVPGATAQDMSLELDFDDGWYVYEGDIIYNRMEYEFEIDADTGTILKWEEERW
ncbi:MAG TPA: PepSY domain-containing protein [Candidatus Mediterraneibacter merdipullorum]|nr:PepSY domain-containing protein [Candidatus Mediterraneibacter merdipullorum]